MQELEVSNFRVIYILIEWEYDLLQTYVQSLATPDLQRLCIRLLGTRGGKSLALSLLTPDPGLDRPPGEEIPPWCKCSRCREMETPRENVCCGHRDCVTTFDHYHLLCLEHNVLTVAILNRAEIYADRVEYGPRNYRKAAYRQYALWTFGCLGAGNRRVIPSCVVLNIRDVYPSPDGVYMGFKEY